MSTQTIRALVQLFFLILFISLAFGGRVQGWIFLLLLGILLSLFRGRFFCGWACPMATIFRGIKRILPRRFPTPDFLRRPGIRWAILFLLVVIMISSRIAGGEPHLILYITAVSVLITLIWQEPFWHRYLCPFGAPLAIAANRSPYFLTIDKDLCTGCGLCERVCPSEAINTLPDGKRAILTKECLQCRLCIDVCPPRAIKDLKNQKKNLPSGP